MKSQLRSYLHSFLRRPAVESEIEAELRSHIELRAEDLQRTGLSPAEALRRARIEFGSVEQHKGNIRASLGLRLFDELRDDLRYAARMLCHSPGFTAVAIASLALGIGANTIIFTVAKGVLLDRLAVPQPQQLRLISYIFGRNKPIHDLSGHFYGLPDGQISATSFSYPVYQLLRQQNLAHPVLEDLFAFKTFGESDRLTITGTGKADTATFQLISGNYFQQLGVQPVLGRAIQPSDDGTVGASPVAVISDSLWSRLFGRSPSVIGKTIQLNLIPVTIIGVAPPSFTGAESVQTSPEVFLPFSVQPIINPLLKGSLLQDKEFWWMQIMGRARPGIGDGAVRTSFALWLAQDIRATLAVKNRDEMPLAVIAPGSQGLGTAGHRYAQPIYLLSALTGFVLLLACANLANLLLARSAARQREMSVRLALGASRSRILRQVLTESLLLSSLGGIAGLILGYFGRNVIPHLLSTAWQPTSLNTHFDLPIFAFAAAISLLTGVLFGVAPAWQATRTDVNTALKDSSSSATRRRKGLAGRSIVVFQIALSMLLVVGAGLFARSLSNLNTASLGFDSKNLLMFDIQAPPSRYPAPADIALHQRIEERLAQLPGVQSVTLTRQAILADDAWTSDFLPTGHALLANDQNFSYVNQVGEDLFTTYRIPILSGRTFNSADTSTSPLVAVINQAIARRFFPGINPIGKTFSDDDGPDKHTYQIIGVSADARYANLREDPPPTFYALYTQAPEAQVMTYVVRTQLPVAVILPALRSVIQNIDKDLPLRDIRTQSEQIEATISGERLFATLTAAFGALALILACIGIYGIMAYSVARRTSEIGIRLALGARTQQILLMVLREATALTLLGIVIGLGAALLGARALNKVLLINELQHQSMLYGIKPSDPATLAAAALLLFAVALLAGWLPARRASRVEPMEALRHE
jgi:predicted permease